MVLLIVLITETCLTPIHDTGLPNLQDQGETQARVLQGHMTNGSQNIIIMGQLVALFQGIWINLTVIRNESSHKLDY
jgi:hypothetical protein